jgi:hypothetical protein
MALANQLFHVNIYNNAYLANQLLQLADEYDPDISKRFSSKTPKYIKAARLPLHLMQDIFFINDYEFIAFGTERHDTDPDHVINELLNLIT